MASGHTEREASNLMLVGGELQKRKKLKKFIPKIAENT